MNKLSINRYTTTLVLMFTLLALDITINTIFTYSRWDKIYLLILFITQDVGIVLSFIIMLFSYFSTYLFKAGLIEFLFDKFCTAILACMCYLILSISLHVWILIVHFKHVGGFQWSTGLLVLFGIQRFISVFHYYFYKRSALRISDPRFYEGDNWIKN